MCATGPSCRQAFRLLWQGSESGCRGAAAAAQARTCPTRLPSSAAATGSGAPWRPCSERSARSHAALALRRVSTGRSVQLRKALTSCGSDAARQRTAGSGRFCVVLLSIFLCPSFCTDLGRAPRHTRNTRSFAGHAFDAPASMTLTREAGCGCPAGGPCGASCTCKASGRDRMSCVRRVVACHARRMIDARTRATTAGERRRSAKLRVQGAEASQLHVRSGWTVRGDLRLRRECVLVPRAAVDAAACHRGVICRLDRARRRAVAPRMRA